WLAKHMTENRDVSVYTTHVTDNTFDPSKPVDNRPKIFFTPGPGTHWMFYGGRPTWIIRSKNASDQTTTADGIGALFGMSGGKRESIHIRILGRSRALAQKLIEEARNLALPQDDKIDIRVSQTSWGGRWLLADRIRPRPFESVILD